MELKPILESLIFASDKPLTLRQIKVLTNSTKGEPVKEALDELVDEYRDRGFQLVEVSAGYQFRTHPDASSWVRKLLAGRPPRLTRAMLETLAIIAYRQPITRPEAEDIRGVDCGGVLRVLLERGLVRIVGKKEDVGRPLLYGTTKQFLEFFNLKDLRELPTLKEFTELSQEHADQVAQEFADDDDGKNRDASAEAQAIVGEAGAPGEPTEAILGVAGEDEGGDLGADTGDDAAADALWNGAPIVDAAADEGARSPAGRPQASLRPEDAIDLDSIQIASDEDDDAVIPDSTLAAIAAQAERAFGEGEAANGSSASGGRSDDDGASPPVDGIAKVMRLDPAASPRGSIAAGTADATTDRSADETELPRGAATVTPIRGPRPVAPAADRASADEELDNAALEALDRALARADSVLRRSARPQSAAQADPEGMDGQHSELEEHDNTDSSFEGTDPEAESEPDAHGDALAAPSEESELPEEEYSG